MKRNSQNRTYATWIGMRSRCRSKNHCQFKHYGGRGIRVCKRWDSYDNFLSDMGEKPDGMSIERIDVDGDYTPENCRWATQSQQMRNMRITRRVVVDGKTYIAADLADQLGCKTDTIVSRALQCTTLKDLLDPNRRINTAGLALGGKASGAKKSARTHCKNGHERNARNTYVNSKGWKICRICACDKERRRRTTVA